MVIKCTKQQQEKNNMIVAMLDGRTEKLSPQIAQMASVLFENNKLNSNQEGSYSLQMIEQGHLCHYVFVNLIPSKKYTVRTLFLLFAAAFKTMKRNKSESVSVVLNEIEDILTCEILSKLLELPILVSYEFNVYKSNCSEET